jgi:hypothetical protein
MRHAKTLSGQVADEMEALVDKTRQAIEDRPR